MKIYARFGFSYFRGQLPKLARAHRVIELSILDKEHRPNEATLKRWRKDAGSHAYFSLLAPKALCALKPGQPFEDAFAELLKTREALEAQCIVIATPVDVTPSPLQRERLQKLVERLREALSKADVRLVWEPRGVWELDTAGKFAQELSVDLAANPIADPHEPAWHPALRYVRVGPVGGREALPSSRLRMLSEIIAAVEKATSKEDKELCVVISTPHGHKDALRLRALVAQLVTPETQGGQQSPSKTSRILSGAEAIESDLASDQDDDSAEDTEDAEDETVSPDAVVQGSENDENDENEENDENDADEDAFDTSEDDFDDDELDDELDDDDFDENELDIDDDELDDDDEGGELPTASVKTSKKGVSKPSNSKRGKGR